MNICIVFGAGAEIEYNLPGGMTFAKNVLGIDNNEIKKEIHEKINDAIKTYYEKTKDNKWYPNRRISNFSKDDLCIAALRKKYLGNSAETQKDYDSMVKDEFDNLSEAEKDKVIDDYTSYMGIFDERFHTIIEPKVLGAYKFWDIVYAYWRAYLSLAKSMCSELEYEEMMNNPIKAYDAMKEWIKEHENSESYYNKLKKAIEKNNNNYSVITTNYTPICETVSQIDSKDISYIHGSFWWFENPENFRLLDASNKDENFSEEVYFPFIMLQSGIKPIINSKQIKEWSKAINFFENADRVVVLGYKINSDDNHFNSIIQEYVVNGTEIVFLDFDGVGDKKIRDRLRLDKEYSNLKYEPINKENAKEKFNNWISNK